MVDELLRIAKKGSFIPEKDQKRMTRYCTKMGYLEKREDGFHITNEGRERLKKGDPRFLDKKAAKERHLKIVYVLTKAWDSYFHSNRHLHELLEMSNGEYLRIVAYCKEQEYLLSEPASFFDEDENRLYRSYCYDITDKGIKYLQDHKVNVYSYIHNCFISDVILED
jgi:hypothetical protein